MVPAEARLPEARGLIEQGLYFVGHAPRQTGKTTTLRALARSLTAEGKHAALYVTCEEGELAQDDYGAAERIVVEELLEGAVTQGLSGELAPPPVAEAASGRRLGALLKAWATSCPRPIVLFLDEIDALRGESLRTVVRQLRAGYPDRPPAFPASVVLCGLHDVRDYKAASGGDPNRLGTSSPFNVKVKSLRIGDFTAEEVRALYAQHTAETGQRFDDAALARAFELTQGQPWLVNALAREVVDEMRVAPAQAIARDHVDEAKERLILARATHLDSLAARLAEPRVRRVVEPMIAGTLGTADETYEDDVLYARDLGLLAAGSPVRPANPIYREVILRVLGGRVEPRLATEPRTFVLPDGRLDLGALLRELAAFWREHGEVLESESTYREVAPQIVLMAYLQRVVNGGGWLEREYGIGRGRIDLLVRWPYRDVDGRRVEQREALELKVWRDRKKDPLSEGLVQLDGYLSRLGLGAGVLAIFDRRSSAEPIEGRTRFEAAATASGRGVTVLRL